MREDELAALKERFPHRLEWSRKFLEMNELVFSIEASYYAAFYAAKAALLHVGIRSKSHQHVQHLIDDLVDDGSLPPDIEGVLDRLHASRNEAAYRVARRNWTEREATRLLELAERFVMNMQRILESTPTKET